MKKYRVTKFKNVTLTKIVSDVIVAESIEAARIDGEKRLHVKGGEFVGAEAIKLNS